MSTFSMTATVKFNKKIKTLEEFSAGGFIMKFEDEIINFDFEWSDKVQDGNDKVFFELRKPVDVNTGEPIDITAEKLTSLSEIQDFYVFTGESRDIEPIKIEELAFRHCDNDDNITQWQVSCETLDKYNEKLQYQRNIV